MRQQSSTAAAATRRPSPRGGEQAQEGGQTGGPGRQAALERMEGLLLLPLLFLLLAVSSMALNSNSNHLVVLSHGIMGSQKDLAYIAERLESRGCLVLVSKANAFVKSLRGIEHGAKCLVDEIDEKLSKSDRTIERISFVGNSLGGLYARMAVYLWSISSQPATIKFWKFLSIASPMLGVSHHNYLNEEFGLPIPALLKMVVSRTMGQTGTELFQLDDGQLLFKMATEEKFLAPLRQFTERRMLANLKNDFVVPLGTASLLDNDQVAKLRVVHSQESGIVAVIKSEQSEAANQRQNDKTELQQMRLSLDSLGWEKQIVHFPGVLPIAHNKIAALRKDPLWFFVNVMGTFQGEHVMDNACEWLTATPAPASPV